MMTKINNNTNLLIRDSEISIIYGNLKIFTTTTDKLEYYPKFNILIYHHDDIYSSIIRTSDLGIIAFYASYSIINDTIIVYDDNNASFSLHTNSDHNRFKSYPIDNIINPKLEYTKKINKYYYIAKETDRFHITRCLIDIRRKQNVIITSFDEYFCTENVYGFKSGDKLHFLDLTNERINYNYEYDPKSKFRYGKCFVKRPGSKKYQLIDKFFNIIGQEYDDIYNEYGFFSKEIGIVKMGDIFSIINQFGIPLAKYNNKITNIEDKGKYVICYDVYGQQVITLNKVDDKIEKFKKKKESSFKRNSDDNINLSTKDNSIKININLLNIVDYILS